MDIKDLTLREKIGQTVIALCTPEKYADLCGSAEAFIKKYPIGGLYPCGGLEKGLMRSVSRETFDETMAEYNKYSKVPLIAACDGPTDDEGIVSFGNQMVLGAANDLELSYEYGKSIASKISACGLHWLFSPCVDLNMSASSPIINVRSISDDVDIAIPIAKQIIKGMQDCGIAATAKHFPGSDDKESVDPHLAPVSNRISKEKWDATYGKLYTALFEDGLCSVMTGHQNLIAYQTEQVGGICPPTTMSHEVVSGLLKGKLGFEGVVVTDALAMGGFTGANGIENQVKCFAAGNDMLLWPSLAYIDEAEQKILAGEIPMERLDDAVSRILELKRRLGILDGNFQRMAYDEADEAHAQAIAEKISEKGITLVRNELGLIPFQNLKKVLIVGVTPADRCYADLGGLKASFEKFGIAADMQRDIWQDELYEKQQQYDLIVFALCRLAHQPIGPLEFWGDNASSIWASNSADPKKVVIASFGSPYTFQYYRETKLTYINAYSPADSVYDAFVKGLLGKIPFVGKSPVTL